MLEKKQRKKKFLIFNISLILGIISITLIWYGKNPFPFLFISLLIFFLVYTLWNPPTKQKNYSYADQQKATSRALGGSGPPVISNLKPKGEKVKQKKRLVDRGKEGQTNNP